MIIYFHDLFYLPLLLEITPHIFSLTKYIPPLFNTKALSFYLLKFTHSPPFSLSGFSLFLSRHGSFSIEKMNGFCCLFACVYIRTFHCYAFHIFPSRHNVGFLGNLHQ